MGKDKGSRSDVGRALLKRLNTQDDIGEVWSKQTAVQRQEKREKLRQDTLKKQRRQKQRQLLKKKLLKRPRMVVTKKKAVFITVLLGVVVFANTRGTDTQIDNPEQTFVQGTSDTVANNELPRETPQIDLLFPAGTVDSDFDIVRISPEGVAPSYTYIYYLQEGGQLNITQQAVPSSFNLEQTAQDFQATDTIQIDGNKIHYGYSSLMKIQSAIFVKEGILFTVRSSITLNDDAWAAFYLGLSK